MPGVFVCAGFIGTAKTTVGASLLAKNPRTTRRIRQHALSLTIFASKLAPTGLPVLQVDVHHAAMLGEYKTPGYAGRFCVCRIYRDCKNNCRSELAREEPKDNAANQTACVIVDDLREQARSYRFTAIRPFPPWSRTRRSARRPSGLCAPRRHGRRVRRTGSLRPMAV